VSRAYQEGQRNAAWPDAMQQDAWRCRTLFVKVFDIGHFFVEHRRNFIPRDLAVPGAYWRTHGPTEGAVASIKIPTTTTPISDKKSRQLWGNLILGGSPVEEVYTPQDEKSETRHMGSV
jgi:hypothetical protein